MPENRAHGAFLPRVRSIYIHSPYCVRRCPYCDFAITLFRDRVPPERFLRSLELEVQRRAQGQSPRTIFVGGGTPTALKPADLDRFFQILEHNLDLGRLVEFSVEANPENLRPDRVAVLVRHGVTRVSIGAQSFDSTTLRVLGRRHDAQQIERSFALLRAAGIRHVNIDCIYAVPGQTIASLDSDIARALSLGPDHLSTYCLTYERDTEITHARGAGLVKPLSASREARFYRHIRARLAKAGYEHYEISNFALPGARCLHNVSCWRHQPYLGLGPSAASFVSGERRQNHPRLADWCARIEAGEDPTIEREALSPERALREAVMLGLRRSAGVRSSSLRRAFGRGFEALDAAALARLSELGLIDLSPDRIRLTARGQELADGVAEALL
ncbi:MAG: radical SAM family heme chaperone HemW [Planctomycetes bacterium]|nr:radical SAM family heme chaperone HemW [Planctomycetota bacterium]